MRIEPADIHAIKVAIDNAPHGFKGAVVKRYCYLYGIGRCELFRKIRKEYGPRRKIEGKHIIDKELIDLVGKLKVNGEMIGEKDRELSSDECINILKDSGVPGADALTISTVNRRLRKDGFRNKDKIVSVEAVRPNQTHQMDFSRSKYFQVYKYDYAKGDYILKVSGKSLSYKESDTKLRTWLVGITDTYSRVSLVMAFAATGESEAIGLEFLKFAYNRPEDEHPLKYIPETLKTDNGAFIKSKATGNALKALEIKSEKVIPYKKRGIQKREAAWKMVWRRFELPLAIQLKTGTEIYLQDYNELLHSKMIDLLEWEHPVRSGTRGHVYKSALKKYPPREIDVDLRDVALRVIYRTVNQFCHVSIKKQKYSVPLFALDKQIRIYGIGSGRFRGELIEEYHEPFELVATKGFVEEGDFEHRAPATYKQQLENQIIRSEKTRKEEIRNKKKEPSKINYMPAESKVQKPDTPFHREKTSQFTTWPNAKEYIGRHLRTEGLDIYDYVDQLDAIFYDRGDDLLNKESLDTIINYYKKDKAANQ